MKDIKGYLIRMKNAMSEKLFFLDKVNLDNYDYVVDFGCADGTLIKELYKVYPNTKFVGLDINEEMIKRANQNIQDENVSFTSNSEDIYKIFDSGAKVLIIFSSVLHEVGDIYEFITDLMQKSNCVIIRDMFFDKDKNRKLNKNHYAFLTKLDQKKLAEFEKEHGKIKDLRGFYHFLLKYNYNDNWNTEVKEDYFSVDYDCITNKLLKNGFEISFDLKYCLPFARKTIKKQFNYRLKHATHRKLIIEKKDSKDKDGKGKE